MGKHAYLIMAHNHFRYLQRLMRSLDDPRNDIYVHIDKKAKFTDFDLLKKEILYSSVYFIQRRDVKWAAFSGILCEMDLLKAATPGYQYDYYHLLSGADIVLKPQQEIHQFFDKNKGYEFVAFDSEEIDPKYLDRIKYYYFFQDVYGRNRKNVFLLGLFALDKALLSIQKLLHINRLKREEAIFQKGTNWFSITHEFALYVISREKWIKNCFRYSLSGDEIFLQTLLINSKFKGNLCQTENLKDNPNMRLIDWTRGKPYTWRTEDYDTLINTDMFFARKVDPDVDNEIINLLEKTMNEK